MHENNECQLDTSILVLGQVEFDTHSCMAKRNKMYKSTTYLYGFGNFVN